MAKKDEINYIKKVAEVEKIACSDFEAYLIEKPWCDLRRWEYLTDISQIMRLIPPPPAKLLDIGVGPGWTSHLFAQCGFDVLGLDISPDMVSLANKRQSGAKFIVCDYESEKMPQGFNIAVIYDALHHSENEFIVLKNIYEALLPGGILVTIEPGIGHSITHESIEVMRKYGTTEKDMPFAHQKICAQKAGFDVVEQYIRISQLPLENIATFNGSLHQILHAVNLSYISSTGHTSIMVAKKLPFQKNDTSVMDRAASSDAIQTVSIKLQQLIADCNGK